jgi:uncharacterized protein (UPF0332 family)
MNGRDFLPLAKQLTGSTTEAEWPCAVSRAYYGAFHVARRLLFDLGLPSRGRIGRINTWSFASAIVARRL